MEPIITEYCLRREKSIVPAEKVPYKSMNQDENLPKMETIWSLEIPS